FAGERVREGDREREQFRSLIGGESEHEPLVAGTLVFAVADALCDRPGLLPDCIRYADSVRTESLRWVGVAYLANRLAHDLFNFGCGQPGIRGDLASDDNQTVLAQRFDRHPGLWVAREIGVEQGV